MTRPGTVSRTNRRSVLGVALVCALAESAVGCGSGSGLSAGSSPSLSASGAESSSAASPAAPGLLSPPAGTFLNPVLADDFPDPFVLRDDATYFAYATTDGAQHLQLARSPDLVHWEERGDPLPRLPLWSSGDTWAPEVAKIGGQYLAYYTAHDPDLKRPDGNGSQCVTVAVSDSPEGPFVDESSKPLVCQADLGGSIDATFFRDADDVAYLIWKNDGNCCGLPTRFFIQRLSKDGQSVTGNVTDLGLVNDEPWEGGVIEAPTMLLEDGRYYLFFSANRYDTELYAVGYATATKVTGPFKDAAENPILASARGQRPTSRARGPGHQSVVETRAGDLWMAYHAWDEDAVGYANFGQRSLWIDPLRLAEGKAVVDGPADGPRPVP
jgi:beta-xylosidase